MPTFLQASINSEPAGAVIFFPSTVRLTSAMISVAPALHEHGSSRFFKRARLAVQMVFKFFSELLHKRHGGHCGRVSEWTECFPQHVFREVIDVVDIFFQPRAGMEARQRLLQPVGAFAAGDAPAAAFMLIELDGAQGELRDA